MTLTNLFDLSFIGRRDQIALEFEGRTFTFGDIDSRSNRVAHYLASRGFVAGDRLCVYLVNSVEMIDLYLACVIFVPINILYRDREMPVAYVVVSEPVEPSELEERCKKSLASFKVPREFIFIEKLPRNAMGKVQKHLLKD
jgi:acyl-coenzyme A synthetase/AMP-(fatty) acid ligase